MNVLWRLEIDRLFAMGLTDLEISTRTPFKEDEIKMYRKKREKNES